MKGGWARGNLCKRERKRLVGPRPEGPRELTGDELGAAVSEGSHETGLCVVTGAKKMSQRKLEGDTHTRGASSCLGLGRQHTLWGGGAHPWGELCGVTGALFSFSMPPTSLAWQILGFLDALSDFQTCRGCISNTPPKEVPSSTQPSSQSWHCSRHHGARGGQWLCKEMHRPGLCSQLCHCWMCDLTWVTLRASVSTFVRRGYQCLLPMDAVRTK